MISELEAARLYAMEAAIKEWKAARKAIFAHTFKTPSDEYQTSLWDRLVKAEHALMGIETP